LERKSFDRKDRTPRGERGEPRSRSNYYAEVTDAGPVLGLMNKHAEEGLPFVSLEYNDNYQEWTQGGTSTMPSLDATELWNLDGINALEPVAYLHLLSIATKIVGLNFGGTYGISIRTSDGRNVSVVPTNREAAYKPMNEIERTAFETPMGGESSSGFRAMKDE
jgi:hypothetical protein